MKSLHKMGTRDLVRLSGKKAVVANVFKKKEETPGIKEPRYKVWLVAKGYNQVSGVDLMISLICSLQLQNTVGFELCL